MISFAAILSGQVLAPLQELHQRATADHTRKRDEVLRLYQHEMACSSALNDSLQRRDRARTGLQGIVWEQERKRKGDKKKGSLGSWLTKQLRSDGHMHTDETEEVRLQRAAAAQTAAIQELASCTDAAAMARVHAEEAASALDQVCTGIDRRRKSVLGASLSCCAETWEEVARSLHATAQCLRRDSAQLQSALQSSESEKAHGSESCTTSGAPCDGRAKPMLHLDLGQSQEADLDDEEDSPFAAPAASWPATSPQGGTPSVSPLRIAMPQSSRGGGSSPSKCFASASTTTREDAVLRQRSFTNPFGSDDESEETENTISDAVLPSASLQQLASWSTEVGDARSLQPGDVINEQIPSENRDSNDGRQDA